MDSLSRRRIALSDSSDSSGTTIFSTDSYTTSKSSPPPFSPSDSRDAPEVCTHAIGKKHPVTRLWELSLREEVMDRVRSQGDAWQAVEVFRRGWSDIADECDATVVITVREGTQVSDWAKIVCGIQDLCTERCGELVQAELLIATLERSACAPWDDTNGIGTSIGIVDDGRSGTLGGYLNLVRSGVVTAVAMTCHHVLSSASDRKWLDYSKKLLHFDPKLNWRSNRAKSLEATGNNRLSTKSKDP